MDSIEDFVDSLTRRKNTPTVHNPYLDKDLADNLRLYLRSMMGFSGRRILLIGEAPGYKGCKITGIPFTSGKIFERVEHPLLAQIRDGLRIANIESENTATIVWEYLADKIITPLFWNSFPFHPHPIGNENKNRAPNSEELKMGAGFLRRLYLLYKPGLVVGVGSKGYECAKEALPEESIVRIRHPSFGGKSEFVKGMDLILQ